MFLISQKFTRTQLCRSIFLNKLQDNCDFKKETLTQVFSCEFLEISKNTYFTELLWVTDSVLSHSFRWYLPIVFNLIKTEQKSVKIIFKKSLGIRSNASFHKKIVRNLLSRINNDSVMVGTWTYYAEKQPPEVFYKESCS